MIVWAREKHASPASLIKIEIAFVEAHTGNGLPARQSRNSIQPILPLREQLTRPIQILAPISQEVGSTRIPVKTSNLLIGKKPLASRINHGDVHHNRRDVAPSV